MIQSLLIALLLATPTEVSVVVPHSAAETPGTCPSAPLLVWSEDFADPHRAFAAGRSALRRTQANFAAAFRRACEGGRLRGWPVIAERAGQSDRLFLKNTQRLTGVWLHLDGEEDAPRADRRIVLEFSFAPPGAAVRVPTVRQFEHAIFCGVEMRYGPPMQTEDIIECLP